MKNKYAIAPMHVLHYIEESKPTSQFIVANKTLVLTVDTLAQVEKTWQLLLSILFESKTESDTFFVLQRIENQYELVRTLKLEQYL